MTNKNLLKRMLIIVVCILLTINNMLSAKAEDPINTEEIVKKKFAFTDKFIRATDDTIVCYMDGVPIQKKEIDNDGFIIQDTINKIDKLNSSSVGIQSTPIINTRTIPSGYNNAIIRSVLTAPSYSQKNTIYYFTTNRGAQFASNLEVGAAASLIAMATGFIPYVGPVITISFTFSTLYKSSVASQIRKRTNVGKKVRINECSSGYGTFYGVFDWTGRKIETHRNYTSGTSEKLTNLLYHK